MDTLQALKDIYETLFYVRNDRSLSYDEIVDRIHGLANRLYHMESDQWPEIETCIDAYDVMAGAYWHLSESYVGQSSPEYAAMCAIRGIYTPSRLSNGPEDDTIEFEVYTNLTELLKGS